MKTYLIEAEDSIYRFKSSKALLSYIDDNYNVDAKILVEEVVVKTVAAYHVTHRQPKVVMTKIKGN